MQRPHIHICDMNVEAPHSYIGKCVSSELMVQIKQKRVYGVENPPPRSFLGGMIQCRGPAFIYVTWMRRPAFICVTWGPRIHICNMNAEARIHICDMGPQHSYVWQNSVIFTCVAFISMTWLVHICDGAHLYVWHGSFKCVTWLIYVCDMTRPYMWRCSIICAAGLVQVCDICV